MPSSTNYGLFGAPSTVGDLRTTATHHRGSPFTFTPASSICLLRRKRAVLRALSLQPLVLRMRTTVYGVTLRWNAVVDGLRSLLTSTITSYLSHLQYHRLHCDYGVCNAATVRVLGGRPNEPLAPRTLTEPRDLQPSRGHPSNGWLWPFDLGALGNWV